MKPKRHNRLYVSRLAKNKTAQRELLEHMKRFGVMGIEFTPLAPYVVSGVTNTTDWAKFCADEARREQGK